MVCTLTTAHKYSVKLNIGVFYNLNIIINHISVIKPSTY